MNLRINDITVQSYERIGAKLFHLCQTQFKESTPINLAVAYDEFDRGIGNATLWLTKHFAIFPVEIGCQNGEVNHRELTRVMQKPGLTLLVQGLPLYDQKLQETRYDSSLPYPAETDLQTGGTVHNHLPVLVGLKDQQAQAAVKRLTQQILVNRMSCLMS